MALPDCGPLGAATGRYERLAPRRTCWSVRANKTAPVSPCGVIGAVINFRRFPMWLHRWAYGRWGVNAPCRPVYFYVSLPQPAGRRQIPRISATC